MAAITFPYLSPSGEYQDHESQLLIQNGMRDPGPLALTGVDPNTGLGNDAVALTGSGFTAVTSVTFGADAATDIVITSNEGLTFTAPDWPSPSTVDVTVHTATESATLPDGFTWIEV